MVKRQGGKVVARSEGAGRGSRFVVTLRAARGSAAAAGQSGAATPPAAIPVGESTSGAGAIPRSLQTRAAGERGSGDAWREF